MHKVCLSCYTLPGGQEYIELKMRILFIKEWDSQIVVVLTAVKEFNGFGYHFVRLKLKLFLVGEFVLNCDLFLFFLFKIGVEGEYFLGFSICFARGVLYIEEEIAFAAWIWFFIIIIKQLEWADRMTEIHFWKGAWLDSWKILDLILRGNFVEKCNIWPIQWLELVQKF